jgi:hypothetical protein
VQELPQAATSVVLTHWPLQAWKPQLQMMPHVPPTQVAVPCASVGQGVQELPQVATAASLTQCPLHAWKPASH